MRIFVYRLRWFGDKMRKKTRILVLKQRKWPLLKITLFSRNGSRDLGAEKGIFGPISASKHTFLVGKFYFWCFHLQCFFRFKIFHSVHKNYDFCRFSLPQNGFPNTNSFFLRKTPFWGHKMAFFVIKQYFCVQVEIKEMILGPKSETNPKFWC